MPIRNGSTHKKIKGLKRKLMSLVWTTVIIFMTIIIIIMTYNYITLFEQRRINDISNQMNRVCNETKFFQSLMDNVSKQIVADVTVQELMDTSMDSKGISLYKRRKVNDVLASFSHVVDPIQEIMIYSADGMTYSSQSTIRSPFNPEENEWYLNYKKKGQTCGFTEVHKSIAMTSGYTEDVISYVMTFYDVKNPKKEMGELIINISYLDLISLLKIDNELIKGMCVYDSNGNEIYINGDVQYDYVAYVNNPEKLFYKNKAGDYIMVSNDFNDGWVFVMEISGEKIRNELYKVLAEYIVVIILLGVVILLILQRFVQRIVTPINQLTNSVIAVGNGDFDTKIEVHTNDEIELLADGFNHMVVDIQTLMRESVENEKIKRKMTVDNLMNQINPHFIYNTLNSIVYMAKSEGKEDIVKFTNTFISLLQGTLKIQDSVYVTLGEELKNIENYLTLQLYRYSNRFDFVIDCKEEDSLCLVPKIMLEPMVENAIFHGIAPKDEFGHLVINVIHEDEIIKIIVSDNGVGMDRDMIEKILVDTEVPKGGIHKIGISNVRKRIKQIYGEEYDIEIDSKPGVGTQVSVSLPYRT